MKLYVMRYRVGLLTRSLHKPEPQIEAPPPEPEPAMFTPTPGLPHNLRAEHIELLLRTGAFTLGLKGLALTQFVNVHIIELEAWWISTSVIPIIVGKILAFAIPIAVVLAILYFTDPKSTDFFDEDIFPQQYFGTFGEKFFYFDLVSVDTFHRGIYKRCRQASGIRMSERYKVSTFRGVLDVWEFNNTWQYLKGHWGDWRNYRISAAFCDYIGLMYHVSDDLYVLRSTYNDPYLRDVQPPWLADPAKLCKMDLPDE